MARQCSAIKPNGDRCGTKNAPYTIHHGDHRHLVCYTHNKVTTVNFVDCNTAEKISVVEQQSFPISNTDGLNKVQALKADLNKKEGVVLDIICATCEAHFTTAKQYHNHVLARHTTRKEVKVAPIPEKPKLGVHCHKLGCKEVTDVRGFFCCGNHGCDHS